MKPVSEDNHESQTKPFLEPDTPIHRRKKKRKKEKHVPSIKAKIEVLKTHPEKTPPLVGYFPSGFNPHKESNEGKEREEDSTTVKVYRNKNKPNRKQLVVSPSGSNVDFVGTNYLGEATAGKQQCAYALGVLDKTAQSLKIVLLPGSDTIFRLEPKVRGTDCSVKEQENLVKEELSVEQKTERMRELTNLYGTKKSITRAKKLNSLKQKDDPESEKKLDGKIKNVVINREALEGTDAETSRNIPLYNALATTPQEAYPLDKIILKGEWNFIDDIYRLLQVGAEVKSDAYPTFVCNRIYKLQEIEDDEEKKTLSCIFSYITHLIKFRDQYDMDGAASAKGHKIPSILRQKFTTMFTQPESKRLPPEKINLLISNVLVLSLFADEFRSNPSDIAKDLRINPYGLRKNYEDLGCKFARQNNITFATLPVPLQFPELRQKRRR